MASQYTSPATSKTRGVPTVHRIAWFSTIPQLLALASALAIGWFATQSSTGMYFGAADYFIYLLASRKLIPRAHRRGIRLSQAQQFEEAIRSHEESSEFFILTFLARSLWFNYDDVVNGDQLSRHGTVQYRIRVHAKSVMAKRRKNVTNGR